MNNYNSEIDLSLKPDDKNAESAQPFCENNHEILESSKINSFHWQKLELGEIMYSYDVKFHVLSFVNFIYKILRQVQPP